MGRDLGFEQIVESERSLWRVETAGAGPQGRLPLTAEMLLHAPSGDVFGLSQNAGMGWDPAEVGRKPFLILSTQGGIRSADGRPVALGYHTGHWEIGLLVQEAAEELPPHHAWRWVLEGDPLVALEPERMAELTRKQQRVAREVSKAHAAALRARSRRNGGEP